MNESTLIAKIKDLALPDAIVSMASGVMPACLKRISMSPMVFYQKLEEGVTAPLDFVPLWSFPGSHIYGFREEAHDYVAYYLDSKSEHLRLMGSTYSKFIGRYLFDRVDADWGDEELSEVSGFFGFQHLDRFFDLINSDRYLDAKSSERFDLESDFLRTI